MRRKAISALLTAAMVLSLAGCGQTGSPAAADTEEAAAAAAESTADSADAAAAGDTEDAEASPAEEDAGETDYSTGSPWVNSNILSNVENSAEVDLKDDFALAIDRQWTLENPIESGNVNKSFLGSYKDELNERLYSILEDDSYEEDHNAALVQTYYTAFLDWDARDAAGVTPLMPYLEEIEAIETMDDLKAYCASTKPVFTSALGVDITPSPEDSSKKILCIESPGFYLDDPADYADLEAMSDYTKLSYECAEERVKTVLLKCGYSENAIHQIYEGAIAYEKLCAANCYTAAEQNLTETLNALNGQVYTSDELSKYDWFAICREAVVNRGIEDAGEYQLMEKMDYFEHLDEILCEENLPLIKDYFLAHTASGAMTMLDKECFYAYLDNISKMRGTSGYMEEREYALSAVENLLSWPLSRLYADRYVTEEDKQNVRDVIEEIVDGYQEMLAKEEFLSEDTRAEAVSKLDHLRINCMYPDDWSKYDYSDLSIADDYFTAYFDIAQYKFKKECREFDEPIDKDEWVSTPITMNAFYSPDRNSINILCGLIGNVLYNADMPKEEVYAKLGVVVGHEISHAFDPTGSTYDADGNYKNWWTEEDAANFKERTDKMVAYYDGITVWDGLNCSGELVKGEACADMGGVAVMLHLAESDPDFDYDLFFRSYAELWANNITPNYAYYVASYNEHPLNYLRVNATVAQFDEFYETYGIEEGDGMYIAPEDRVKIW